MDKRLYKYNQLCSLYHFMDTQQKRLKKVSVISMLSDGTTPTRKQSHVVIRYTKSANGGCVFYSVCLMSYQISGQNEKAIL